MSSFNEARADSPGRYGWANEIRNPFTSLQ